MRLVTSGLTIALIACLAACTATPTASLAPTESAEPTDPTSQGSSDSIEVTSIYYPVAVGNRWVYSIDYGSGSLVTDTEVMTAIHAEGDGARVSISRTFHWDDKSRPDVTDSVDYVFAADGSLTVPFQSIPSAESTIIVSSGTVAWPTPAEFDAGTTKTGRIEASVFTNGTTAKETVDFTISGGGVQDVTVPAGTFSARVLNQALVVSLPDLDVNGLALTAVAWLDESVGLVKTIVPDHNGATITQVLVSFTPGR
ncbi:MAG: hypothetical protein KF761_07035 [Salinibacterium sp.]|nr:hypothetical protein [Salinibacterium sp.]